MSPSEVEERWRAMTFPERERTFSAGRHPVRGESVPDYAQRVLKLDPKITLAGGRTVATIFRAAYDELATQGPSR